MRKKHHKQELVHCVEDGMKKKLGKKQISNKQQQQNVASVELNVDLFELTQNELFLIKLDI